MLVRNSRSDGGSVPASCVVTSHSVAAILVVIAAATGCSADAPQQHEETVVATEQAVVTPGTWTPVTAQYPSGGGPEQIQLLMDGTILATDGKNAIWRRYIPDPVSGYVGGHWVTAATSHYGRVYFATGMLRDGRYLICGGEDLYLKGTQINVPNNPVSPNPVTSNKCEIFNPIVNFPTGQWQDITDFPGDVRDGILAPLADGRLLMGPAVSNGSASVFDPTLLPLAKSPWVASGALPIASAPYQFNEGSLTPLQNDKIFFTGLAESIFTPSTGTWSSPAINLPANSPFGAVYGGVGGGGPVPPAGTPPNGILASVESGAALTLYDGRVFIAGSAGHNAIYNPSGGTVVQVADTPGFVNVHKYLNDNSNPSCNTSACPTNSVPYTCVASVCQCINTCPNGHVCLNGACLVDQQTSSVGPRMDENGQTVMPNGNILAAVIRWDFNGAYSFYEYAPDGGFTPLPNGPSFTGGNVVQTPLPDGGVLVANAGSSSMYIYRYAGPQLTLYGQPIIKDVTGPVSGVYTMTGSTLNGLTNGANRDDEGQNGTEFPIIWVNVNGQRRYCNVTSVSTASIGQNTPVTVQFSLPSDLPLGAFMTVGVSASGLQGANTFLLNANVSGSRGLLLLQ